MRLFLDRFYKGNRYTIGRLYIDGEYFCDTCEDVDRGLTEKMDISEIKLIKVVSETAIPRGTYEITLNVQSPKYSKREYYKNFCNGYLPRLLNVPGFDGILIHAGNTAADSSGCILPGFNRIKGQVNDSKKTFEKLYYRLKYAHDINDKITIEIK